MKKLNKVLNCTKNCFFATGLIGSLYLGGLYTSQKISQNNSPKINNQIHLEKFLKEERKRAGIKESIKINAIVGNEGAYSQKIGKEEYNIYLPYKDLNLSTLRHELYHITDGHCIEGTKTKSSLRYALEYLFWYEPKATIYEITGLKP